MEKPLTYADAGVDIDKGNDLVKTIKELVKQTPRTGVMGEIGGFGGLFSLNAVNFKKPVLVSSTDGVGTKLKIAFMMGKHDTIGIDLVAMSVNDVAVQGAKPLFFLDYLAMGTLNPAIATDIIKGIVEGCKIAPCALIGGETAEMPGIYAENEYDLAGFVVGIVDNDKLIDGSEIRVGHKLVGLASTGLHSNGYSLVRKICFDRLKLQIDTHMPEFGRTLGEELLEPTRIYAETIQNTIRDLPIHGIAHITGGGLAENIVRVIPQACGLQIHLGSWELPPVFRFLKDAGNLSTQEMMRTFNNGIGLVMIVPSGVTQEVVARLAGMHEKPVVIGEVTERNPNADRVQWV